MFVHSHESLFKREIWPLWLGLLLVAVGPFLSIYRVGPLSSFFLEAGSLLGVLLLVLLSAFSGCLQYKIPRASIYFLVLAAFWAIQARVMDLTYVGLSDMVVWTFVILALGCWAARGWVLKIGQERCLSVLAGVLVLGCLIQAVIGWMQYTGAAAGIEGLMYRAGIVEGQLAQRNHFGHYMMWGVLATAWLWAQRRLPWWAASLVMVFFASVMALTGSRTIFAYVLAMVVLVPFVGLLSGSLKSRVSATVLLAAAVVLLFQFALEPILSLFAGDVQSAAERLGAFGGSGRSYEWNKAWLAFLSAPWFGHGWGSYPLQSFLINIYPNGFRPYETSVLFTHSHNSFLNLLAEMGLVGTMLVMGGLLWCLWGCFKRGQGIAGLFILALISVSLVHSFVEYPLWYIYFLSVFALFIGFAPPTTMQEKISTRSWQQYGGVVGLTFSLILIVGIVRLGFAYQDLRFYSDRELNTKEMVIENFVELNVIAKTEPMLRYYADFQVIRHVPANTDTVTEEAAVMIRNNLKQRPFAAAYHWSLVAARQGKIQEARDWMQLVYRYYPSKFQELGNIIMKQEKYAALRDDYTKTCYAYYQSIQKLPQCVSAEP